jgi:formate dehydrogenase major subunit
LADYPSDAGDRLKTGRDELLELAAAFGIDWDGGGEVAGIPPGAGRGSDGSSPVIHVNHQACILCDRCIRACDDLQVNEVIGRTGKGYETRIGFDLDDPMGTSSCVACGECEKVCPTGALSLQILIGDHASPPPAG